MNFFRTVIFPIPNIAEVESHPLTAWMKGSTVLMSGEIVIDDSLMLHDFLDIDEENTISYKRSLQ